MDLKQAWLEIITPDDLDAHMEMIGQAEANGQIVSKMLREHPVQRDSKLIIPGIGTGQVFEYIDKELLERCELICTDINEEFLSKARERMQGFKGHTMLDDIEITGMIDVCNTVLAVLLLEHVDWQKAIDSMVQWEPDKIFLILQKQNELKDAMISIGRKLRASIRVFREAVNPHIVNQEELASYLDGKGYRLIDAYERDVPDNKQMVGLVFEKEKS